MSPAAKAGLELWVALLARVGLGVVFISMGLPKALEPVEFLKLVRAYDLLPTPFLLNLVAAGLPWFEVFCGLCLILGIAVRGTALMLILMLVPFTLAVWDRALGLQVGSGLSFCAIKFDCGCGAGEVFICRKLVENALLTAAALCLALWPRHRFCLLASALNRPLKPSPSISSTHQLPESGPTPGAPPPHARPSPAPPPR